MDSGTANDRAKDWEFKMLHTASGRFGDPERLRAILDEEARAGWVLLEKFDDNRLRLKREASARGRDGSLGFDPYRTFVGPNQAGAVLLIVGLVLLGMLTFLALPSRSCGT